MQSRKQNGLQLFMHTQQHHMCLTASQPPCSRCAERTEGFAWPSRWGGGALWSGGSSMSLCVNGWMQCKALRTVDKNRKLLHKCSPFIIYHSHYCVTHRSNRAQHTAFFFFFLGTWWCIERLLSNSRKQLVSWTTWSSAGKFVLREHSLQQLITAYISRVLTGKRGFWKPRVCSGLYATLTSTY